MKMDSEVWYAIRNTPGILGFVGSSGKGAMPIPISIEEYQKIDDTQTTEASSTATTMDTPTVDSKKIYETDIKVGNTIEIIAGNFVGMTGEVKFLDFSKGQAKVELEMFGRITSIDVNFDEIKLAI
jgi:transcriptional antiterminator NusG